VGSTTTTRYLQPGFEAAGISNATVLNLRVPRAGTLRNFYVHARAGNGNGNAIVYTVQKNNANTAITVSMLSTAVDGSDLVNSVAIAAGDLLQIIITKAAGIGASPDDVIATLELG